MHSAYETNGKKMTAERFAKLVKLGTGAVIGAAAIAVFCRSCVPLKNSTEADIVSSTLTVSAADTTSEREYIPQSVSGAAAEPSENVLININTATSEELQTLSGIGEAKAGAIIAYREEHGAFGDIGEIMNVGGIGEKIFENIRDLITVGEQYAPTGETSRDPGTALPEAVAVNINTATSEELQTLSGIGKAKAEAIIAYREEHGAFGDVGEIMNVSGIGEKIFQNIRDNITV